MRHRDCSAYVLLAIFNFGQERYPAVSSFTHEATSAGISSGQFKEWRNITPNLTIRNSK
jgi:hypothetical protein